MNLLQRAEDAGSLQRHGRVDAVPARERTA